MKSSLHHRSMHMAAPTTAEVQRSSARGLKLSGGASGHASGLQAAANMSRNFSNALDWNTLFGALCTKAIHAVDALTLLRELFVAMIRWGRTFSTAIIISTPHRPHRVIDTSVSTSVGNNQNINTSKRRSLENFQEFINAAIKHKVRVTSNKRGSRVKEGSFVVAHFVRIRSKTCTATSFARTALSSSGEYSMCTSYDFCT